MSPENSFFVEPHVLPLDTRRSVEGRAVTHLDPVVLQRACGDT